MAFIQFLFTILCYYLNGNQQTKDEAALVIAARKSGVFEDVPLFEDVATQMKKGVPLNYEDIAQGLRDHIKAYDKLPTAKKSFSAICKAFATWLATDSQTAFATLERASALCSSPYIRAYLAKKQNEIVDQTAVRKYLKKLTKSFGGSGQFLTLEESKAAKEADPEAYKKYLELKRSHTLAWKDALSSYVRNSGQLLLPFKQVEKYLAGQGIEHTLPVGFTGKVDASGSWYTDEGDAIIGVPSSTMFPSVVMNTAGEGDWVFQAIRPDGSPGNYFTTKAIKSGNRSSKFEKAKKFSKNIASYRKKWLSNIQVPLFDFYSISSAASVVIELLYQSSHRVGTTSGGNAEGAGFGISSILCKHVTFRDSGDVLISYRGKDGVNFKWVIKPSANDICHDIAFAVHELCNEPGKTPSDPVFTYRLRSGQWKPVRAGAVSKYFGSITGGVNIHKLRTYWGTKIFNEAAAKVFAHYKTMNDKNAIAAVKACATLVGKKLGHVTRNGQTGETKVNPSTSLQNYIDISAQVAFFENYGLALPGYLEKMLAVDNTITAAHLGASYEQIAELSYTELAELSLEDLQRRGIDPSDVGIHTLEDADSAMNTAPEIKRMLEQFLDGSAQKNNQTILGNLKTAGA
jgi:hypothetical protein